MKMGNQFRGLDTEEVNFLEAHQRERHAEEAARKRADDDVLEAFRQCVSLGLLFCGLRATCSLCVRRMRADQSAIAWRLAVAERRIGNRRRHQPW